ncbi:MAG: ankyrin repeat domain-containing protein [Endomicrobium sp.]|jgi:ankyrin repeat protein|nr:ankyrin repeat domain-containing protein [Endomicrobium sp.]
MKNRMKKKYFAMMVLITLITLTFNACDNTPSNLSVQNKRTDVKETAAENAADVPAPVSAEDSSAAKHSNQLGGNSNVSETAQNKAQATADTENAESENNIYCYNAKDGKYSGMEKNSKEYEIEFYSQEMGKDICKKAYDLQIAAGKGEKEKVLELLKEGIDADVQSGKYKYSDKYGTPGVYIKINPSLFTPLMSAVQKGKKEIAEILLKAGADPNILLLEPMGFLPDYWYRGTALIFAIKGKYEDIVKILLDSGKFKKSAGTDTALLWASCKGSKDIVQLLLKLGLADIDRYGFAPGDSHYTPLMCAAKEGHKEIVEILLNAGANPNEVNLIIHQDFSPGTAYSEAKNEEIKEVLLKAGADKDLNKLALIEAVASGSDSTVKEILLVNSFSGGSDINAKDKDGNSALSLALKNGNQKIIDMLKQADF